jgi:choline dehydrogenase-like flavoprotein
LELNTQSWTAEFDEQISFLFYETKQPDLTTDIFWNWADSDKRSYEQWKLDKTGAFSKFPFGSFAWARLDERLKDSALWNSAPRRPGRDPMDLTPAQPNVEFWGVESMLRLTSEQDPGLYGKHIFGITTLLFNQKARGTVKLESRDPNAKPIVDNRFLQDPLDQLVLSEGVKMANEIIMQSEALSRLVSGSWPPESGHHTFSSSEQWLEYVKQSAWTCKFVNVLHYLVS